MATLLDAGDMVDDFRVVARAHFGGLAVLYRAERSGEAGRPVMLKVPRLAQGDDPLAVVCHEVERTMLGALSGPHVPALVAAGDLERQPYLAMEWIDGPSLKDWADRAPLPAAEIVRLLVPLANAVHGLHCQQVVHLDLKPANVIYRRRDGNLGEAVLIDLGLAHHAHLPDLLAEEFRKPLGSGPYMAPEQVLGMRCDPRSDLFALGVILYELATGALPFGSPTSIGGLRRRLYRDPPPPRALAPATPEWLQEIILRCLEADAGRRYATAAQLAFDLAHGDQVVVGERGRRLRRQGPLARWRRWFRAIGYEPAPCPPPTEGIAAAPIVLVAVALQHQDRDQEEALRQVVKRLASMDADYRMAVVTVIPLQPLLGGEREDESGGRIHIRHLVELRHWAAPLGLAAERLTCHVVEDDDGAAALLAFARQNQVDQIVIGAPPMAGTVASRVMLEAPCTVTLVRPRQRRDF